MAGVDFQPKRPRELLGVYADQATAQRVLDLVQEKIGVEANALDQHSDNVDSLRAEMREEMEQSVLAPQAGLILTKESAKSMALIMPVALVLGVLVSLPLAFFFARDVSFAVRLGAAIGVGVALGGTMGFVLTSLGAKGPSEPMAAERGVTVRVHSDRDDVRAAMLEAHPIRLDVIDDTGKPIETIATEEQESDTGAVQDLGDRMTNWP